MIRTFPLGAPPWPTRDPFLFCVHHHDRYPTGTADLGVPDSALVGRQLGLDFSGKDGWSLYHGHPVPGFPQHPHRGFETVTIARQGFIDHSDSLGAKARFGSGDTQWMTAGRGIVHAEMFPLLNQDRPNPTELFQIWLNLPREDKMVSPYFTMLWRESIPQWSVGDDNGAQVTIGLFAGELDNHTAPAPPPDSWAAKEAASVCIASIQLEPHASWTLPGAAPEVDRTCYFFQGTELVVGGPLTTEQHRVSVGQGIELSHEASHVFTNGPTPGELLLLAGRPIGQPVVQHGPFVMNQEREIMEAVVDYQATQFGGWPWNAPGPTHPKDAGRFARHADGRRERPEARATAAGPTGSASSQNDPNPDFPGR